MKKYLLKTSTIIFVILTIIASAIPFASAATQAALLDSTRKVSVTLNCTKPGYEAEIRNKLESMQQAVGDGLIEPIYMDDGCVLVGNEESKLRGMQGNRRLDGGGIIAGPFFICGDSGEDFRSLTDDEVNKYMEKYAEPEDISDDETQADMGFAIYTF